MVTIFEVASQNGVAVAVTTTSILPASNPVIVIGFSTVVSPIPGVFVPVVALVAI